MDIFEAALAAHPRVQAAGACWDEQGKRLVAAIVSVTAGAPMAHELDRWLRHRTGRWTLPERYVEVDALPLRTDGSTDRRQLADMASGASRIETGPRHRRTEKALTKIWRSVLNRRDVEPDANFFALGGDLVVGVELAARARRAGIALDPVMVLLAPTIAELTTLLEDG